MSDLQQQIAELGLKILGVLEVDEEDRLPALPGGDTARLLLLVGNAGPDMWPVFSASAEYADGNDNPLDRWSQRVTEKLTERFGVTPLFPFGGPPHWPFVTWAQRARACHSSPLGMALHPRYGLWHAYRFALLTNADKEHLVLSADSSADSDCVSCTDQPCLSACPVNAFTGSEYLYKTCAEFLAREPDYPCNHLGCAARRACPVGREFLYPPAQAAFHTEVFVRVNTD